MWPLTEPILHGVIQAQRELICYLEGAGCGTGTRVSCVTADGTYTLHEVIYRAFPDRPPPIKSSKIMGSDCHRLDLAGLIPYLACYNSMSSH